MPGLIFMGGIVNGRNARQYNASQKGVAVVEGALTLLTLLVCLFGIMEAARFMSVQQVITQAAREGARFAVTPLTQTSTLPTDTEIRTVVNRFLDSGHVSGATTTITRPPDPSVVIDTGGVDTEFIKVEVNEPYQLITLSMFSNLQFTLHGRAMMRSETSP
jgi:hypothetical protein